MIQSSFKIALLLCLFSLFCVLFLGDPTYLAYGDLFGLPIVIIIFVFSTLSFMSGLISIGRINGFWSLIGTVVVIFLSFGIGVFSGYIWLLGNTFYEIK